MDDERRGWRALPPPLVLALGLTAVQTVVMVVYGVVFEGQYGPPIWVSFANRGAEATENALYAYGAAMLAQRHTGAQRRGLQIAAAAWFAALVLPFGWLAMSVLVWSPWPAREDTWIAVESYSWFAVDLLPAVGLAVATLRRHRVLALASIVIAAVSHPPPFAARAIRGWLALGHQGGRLFWATLALLGLATIAALITTLAPATTMPEPARAAVGLRRAITGLRIQMLAVIVGTFPILFATANHGRGFSLFDLELVTIAAINTAASGWLAVGLLGAARDRALARTKLVVAGAAALWCGAVMLTQLVFLYAALYGASGDWSRVDANTLTREVPLVALAGAALLAAALGPFVARYRQEAPGTTEETTAFAGLAARAREDQLRRDQRGPLPWIIVLMLASAVIEGWLMTSTTSLVKAEALTLVSAVCSLVALAMIARLCRDAAAALDREPGLPAARLVGPG
jgi:hypothetical protein